MNPKKITQGALLEYSKKALRRSVAFIAAFFIVGTSYAQITMQSGSYVGDGTNNRTITGAGFTPAVVMVKAANSHESQIKTSTMASGYSKQMQNGASVYLNRILSLTSNGFVIGTDNDVNDPGVIYYWTAFKAGADLKVGSYVGNDADNRNITGAGMDPDMVFVLPESGNRASFRTNTMVGDECYHFGSAELPNTIQAFVTGGFQVGSDPRANDGGVIYHYVAFKASESSLKLGTYTGNDVDGRAITGVGFQPEYMFIKKKDNTYAVQRSSQMPANSSVEFASSGIDVGRIKSFTAGGFTVGTHAQVNDNNKTYYYVCFRNGCVAPSGAIAGSNSPSNSPICEGSALNLTSSVNGYPTPTASWSGAGAFSSTTVANPTVTGAQTGNYVVTYTNACGTTSATTAVVVNTAPSSAVAGSNSPLCEGETLNLTSSVNGYPMPTASWSGAGAFSSTTVANPTLTGAQTGNYVVTYTNACGATSATTAVVVNTAPSSAAAGSNSPLCEGETLNLTSSVNGYPTPTASWSGAGAFSSTTVANPTVTGAQTGNYVVTYTNACGATSATTAVVVNTAPFSAVAGSNSPFCEGKTLNLTSSVNGYPTPAASWTGAGTFSSTTEANPTVTGAATGNYVVTYTNACGTTSATAAVVVNNFAATATNTPILCHGGTSVVTVTATGGIPPYSGTGAQAARPAGPYSYTVTDANNCSFIVSGTISQPTTVVAAVSPAITCLTTGYGPTSVTLLASGTGGTGTIANTTLTVSPTTTSTACVNNTYTLTVTDANGCSASTTASVQTRDVRCYSNGNGPAKVNVCHRTGNGGSQTLCIDATSVANHLAHGDALGACGSSSCCATSYARMTLNGLPVISDFKIYPNPTNRVINLDIPYSEGEAQVLITDVTGRIVISRTADAGLNAPVAIDIQQIPNGLYLVKVIVAGTVYAEKFSKY